MGKKANESDADERFRPGCGKRGRSRRFKGFQVLSYFQIDQLELAAHAELGVARGAKHFSGPCKDGPRPRPQLFDVPMCRSEVPPKTRVCALDTLVANRRLGFPAIKSRFVDQIHPRAEPR